MRMAFRYPLETKLVKLPRAVPQTLLMAGYPRQEKCGEIAIREIPAIQIQWDNKLILCYFKEYCLFSTNTKYILFAHLLNAQFILPALLIFA